MSYIVNKDARDYLKEFEDDSIALVLTDPPYIISRESGFKNVGKNGVERFAIDIDFGMWDNTTLTEHTSMLIEVFAECFRVLRPGGIIIVWYDLWKLGLLQKILLTSSKNSFRMFRFIEWVKTNPVPINSKNLYLTNAREVAIVAVKGTKPKFYSEYHNGIFEYPIHRDGTKRIHPTQKSLALMEELITLHTDKGDTVLDPFSGSGTTVLAAYLTERIGKGCELDKAYATKANSRLINHIGNITDKPVWDY